VIVSFTRSPVHPLIPSSLYHCSFALDAGILFFLVIFCLFAPHSIAVTQVAFYTALLLWLIKIILRRKLEYTGSAFDLPVIAFVAFTGLSAVFSYERAVSFGKLGSVSLVLIFFLVAQQVRTVRLAKTLVLMMLVSCMVNVGYVFWEKVQGRGLKIVQMKPESPLAAARLTPGDVILDVNGRSVNSLQELLRLARQPDRDVVTLFVYRPEIYFRRTLPVGDWNEVQALGVEVTPWHQFRAAGFYGWNYFTYAEVLQLLASIAFGLLLLLRRKFEYREKTGRKGCRGEGVRGCRGEGVIVSFTPSPIHPFTPSFLFFRISPQGVALALMVISMSAAIILTVTRAVWIAFAGALLAMSLRVMNKWAVLIILVGGLAAAPVALNILQQTRGQRLLSTQEPSTAYRLTVWKEGVHLLMSRPKHLAFGIGMDSLKVRWREWGLFQGGKLPLGHMHSTPLQIALERGIPALICFTWWFGAYVLLLWRLTGRRAASLDWVSRGICLGIFGGTIGFLISSLVHYNFGDSEVIMIVYFLMGVSVIMERETRTSQVKWVNESTGQ